MHNSKTCKDKETNAQELLSVSRHRECVSAQADMHCSHLHKDDMAAETESFEGRDALSPV